MRLFRRAAPALLACLLAGDAAAAAQSAAQQRCLRSLTQGLTAVSAAHAARRTRCIVDAARDGSIGSLSQCLMDDPTGRATRAATRLMAKEEKRCRAARSDFGSAGARALVHAAAVKEGDIARDLLGADLAGLMPETVHRDMSRCQQALVKASWKCERARLKSLHVCARDGARDGSLGDAADLAACLDADPKGLVARLCDPAAGALRGRIDKACALQSVDLAGALPGLADYDACAPDTAFGLASCIDASIACRVCLGANDALALDAVCDVVDDGASNQSCPPQQLDASQFASLQAAIDAAPDGARVNIPAGTTVLASQVVVQGRRLILSGAGADSTVLSGPVASPVVDASGAVVLAADDADGLLTLIGSDVRVEHMLLSGGESGVLIQDAVPGEGSFTRVVDVAFEENGRGIVNLGSGDLTIVDAEILAPLWHGISVAPRFVAAHGSLPLTLSDGVTLLDPQGAGVYFSDTTGVVHKSSVSNASAGGIVGYRSNVLVTSSSLLSNRQAGVLLVESRGIPLVKQNHIVSTLPLSGGGFGDGISVWDSIIHVEQNGIDNSARVGVSAFGSTVHLIDNTIVCSALADLQSEELAGVPSQFLGPGNTCGCTMGPEVCDISSGAVLPPPNVGGLE